MCGGEWTYILSYTVMYLFANHLYTDKIQGIITYLLIGLIYAISNPGVHEHDMPLSTGVFVAMVWPTSIYWDTGLAHWVHKNIGL
jgi:hypothetical protein